MIAYLFLMSITMLMSFVMKRVAVSTGNGTASRKHDYRIAFLVLIIVYVFIVGLRYDIGTDWINYHDSYDRITRGVTSATTESLEPGYYIMNQICSELNLGFYSVMCLTAFLVVYCFVKASSYVNFTLPYALLFFYCFFFNESMNIVRQVVSLTMVYYAAISFIEDRKRKAAFWFILAVSFHKSAITSLVYIPFLYFNPFKKRTINLFLIIGVFFAGELLYTNLKDQILLLTSMIPMGGLEGRSDQWGFEVFEAQAVDWNGQIAKYAYLLVDIVVVWFAPKMSKIYRNKHFDFFFSLFMIGQILRPIIIYHSLFERTNYYFHFFIIPILAFTCHALWNYKITRFNLVIQRYVVFLICLMFFFLHLRHLVTTDLTPYKNVLMFI